MALAVRAITLDLDGGLETKSDRKAMAPARLAIAENLVYTKPGQLSKRFGYAALTREIAGATTITSAQALATFKREMLLADTTSLYSYDAGAMNWTAKGSLISAHVTTAPVIRDTYAQTRGDGVTHAASGLQFYAFESAGGLCYTVLDGATGQIVRPSTVIAANGLYAKTLVVGNLFVVYWYDSGTQKLYGATLPAGAPAATLVPVALTPAVGDANSPNTVTPRYDATYMELATIGPTVYLAFYNAIGGTSTWSFSGTAPLSLGTKIAQAGVDSSGAVTVFAENYRNGPMIVASGATAVRFYAYDGALLAVPGSGGIEAVTSGAVTGVSLSSTAILVKIFYTVAAANPAHTQDYTAHVATISSAAGEISALGVALGVLYTSPYTVVTDGVFLRSVGVAGKAFARGALAYVPVIHQSTLQTTYFLADHNGQLVAKAFPGVGSIDLVHQRGRLPETSAASSTAWRMACMVKGASLLDTAGALVESAGISAAAFDFFDPMNSYGRAELGNNLHFGGGFVQMYDGVSVVEHGFHLFPEGATSDAGGATYSYDYAFVYEWMDAQGQIHRSAPSVPLAAVMNTEIGGGTTVTLTVPTLRLTAKRGARSPVSIVAYRTLKDATTQVFYRISAASATLNDPTVDSVTIVDATTDAVLVGALELYSNGDVRENDPAPAMSVLTVHDNRLFGVDAGSPSSVWYSKEVVPAQPGASPDPVAFSGFQTLGIDPRGGGCTALASIDATLIVFKESSIFAVSGQGPTAAGATDDYRSMRVNTDCGCINPRSIVTVPAGLMYQSRKGIYLLNRALEATYIGADVEAYNAATVTGAALIPTTNQVRFTLDSGIALVFDYYGTGHWSTFTNVAAVDAAIWGSTFVYLRSNGQAMQETAGIFTDDGSPIRFRAQTSVVSLAGMQGFGRAYKALILGEYASPHDLVVSVAYDFSTVATQTAIITPTPVSAFGADSPFGSGAVYGGAYPLYQWRLFFANQRCQAIQITIEDAQATATAGEGFSLSLLGLEVGVEPGLWRQSAARSFG